MHTGRIKNDVEHPFLLQVKTKDYMPGIFCTPLFHCPRCKDYWTEFGTVPDNCQFARQPTRGPAIHLASNRKPRSEARGRKTKRRLGFVDMMLCCM